MKTVVVVILLFATMIVMSGCFTNIHKVGNGPQGNEVLKQRQWYVLWGLVPINEVYTETMAAGATDYEVKTSHEFIDVVIGVFTQWVSVLPKTVQVTK